MCLIGYRNTLWQNQMQSRLYWAIKQSYTKHDGGRCPVAAGSREIQIGLLVAVFELSRSRKSPISMVELIYRIMLCYGWFRIVGADFFYWSVRNHQVKTLWEVCQNNMNMTLRCYKSYFVIFILTLYNSNRAKKYVPLVSNIAHTHQSLHSLLVSVSGVMNFTLGSDI